MTVPEDNPYLLMIGADLPAGASPEETATFNDAYTQIHAPEVVESHPGMVRATRYELIGPDQRGDRGPGWLAVYEMTGRAAADAYIARVESDRIAYPAYRRWTGLDWSMRWRVVWQRHAAFSGGLGRPARPYLLLIGMDVPDGTSEQDLADFDAFYTNTHVGEVVDALAYDRAVRYERYRSLVHPEPGCPRFMAAYDGDEKVIIARADPSGRPPINMDGPVAWNSRNTAWRLLYRRVSSYARLSTIEP